MKNILKNLIKIYVIVMQIEMIRDLEENLMIDLLVVVTI